jgi:hypothetical protein
MQESEKPQALPVAGELKGFRAWRKLLGPAEALRSADRLRLVGTA